MAFDSQGFWKPEKNDAAQKVADVVSAGGPLMKQAKGLGMQTANKRGLGNSSIAAGAAQNEVYRVAVPIGLQNSQQIAAKNLAALNANENLKYGTTLQQMQDTAAKDRLGMQIASTEKLAGNELAQRLTELDKRIGADLQLAREGDAAAMERLQADLASRAQLQAGELASRERITGMELASRENINAANIASNEKLTAQQIAAEMAQLDKRIAGDMALAQQGDAAAMARLQTDLASREQLAAMEIGSRERLQAQSDAAAMDRLSAELGSREALTMAEIEARTTELDKRISADFALAQQGDAAAQQRLETDLAARAQLQAQSDLAALTRQREEIAARTDLAAADREARLAELDKQIEGNRTIAQMDIEARQNLVETEGQLAMDRAQLDAETRLSIADQEEQLQRDRLTTDAAANATNAYMQAMTASMNNADIPADVRAAYQASLERATQANLALINQVNGSELQWGTSPGPTNQPNTDAEAPPTPYNPYNPYNPYPYYQGGGLGSGVNPSAPPIMTNQFVGQT